MFCRKCGNQLYDSDLFCNRCGAPVNPSPEDLQKSQTAVGLTPAAKDSERIIEEFYKSNRRKEETQSILDMEFAAISGEPVDLRDLSAYTYRGREDYAAPQVTFRPAPQFEDLFEDAKRQEAEAAPAPVIESVVAPTPIPVEIVAPVEEVIEPSVDEVAEQVVEEVAEQVVEEVAEPVVEEVIEPVGEVEEITEEIAPAETAVEELSEITPEELENKYNPTEEDLIEWDDLFPNYEPTLFFDPPEYILYEMSETAPTAAEPQAETKVEAPQVETKVVAPTSNQQVEPSPMQNQQVEPSPIQNLQVEPSPMPTFDAQKTSINREAQATLDMLDQLFADFDKPIADSVGVGAGYAAPNYAASTYNQPSYAAPTYAAPTYTSQPSNVHTADLDKFAPATASGIATGKAIQKAVLDPEEEPPEEGFEDDEDFEDAPDTSLNGDAKSADAGTAGNAGDGNASDDKSNGKSGDSKSDKSEKKEKKGLFRRKSKDVPEEPEEEEEEEKTNVQKRSNVIVLNPEFLNADEKASGKGTEDFKIASNMTHGVRAMDRAMPRDYEEEEEYYEPRRGGNVLRKVMMGILTALLALAAVISILITFGRDTTAGQAVLNFWDNIKGIVSEEQDEPASEAELNEDIDEPNNAGESTDNSGTNTEGNAADDTNTGDQGENGSGENGEPSDSPENSDNPENSENGEQAENPDNPDNSEEPAADVLRIVNENFNAAEGGFGEAVQEPELVMAPGVFYSLDGFHDSHIFSDSEWYQDENGESVTTNAAIFYTVSDYYDKLIARMNRDSEEVLALILPDTKLMTDVSGIRADAIVLHAITKLEIGEARTNDDNYYVIVRINEVTNDGRPASTYKRVLRLVPDNEEHTFKVAEVVVGD